MCKRYDFDFVYMDTGQGGVTRFDWDTKWGAQDYDWSDLYRGWREYHAKDRRKFCPQTPWRSDRR